MEFENLVESVHSLNESIGGEWESPFQLLWIYEEMGELSKELLKFSDLPAKLHDDHPEEIRNKMKEELGDILYGLISLAKNIDISVTEALEYSLKKFQKRHQK